MCLSSLPDLVPALVTGTHRSSFSSYLFSCREVSFGCCRKYENFFWMLQQILDSVCDFASPCHWSQHAFHPLSSLAVWSTSLTGPPQSWIAPSSPSPASQNELAWATCESSWAAFSAHLDNELSRASSLSKRGGASWAELAQYPPLKIIDKYSI